MNTLTITTSTAANAKFLATFLKTVKIVKSVVINEKSVPIFGDTEVSEPAGELQLDNKQIQRGKYNWTNPTRPATDEEFEQMISEAEKEIELGLGIPSDLARKQTLNELKKWRKQKL